MKAKIFISVIALFTYANSFAQFVSTSEVTIAGGPYVGNASSDFATHVSEIYKVIIDADDPNTTIDDMLTPLNAILTVRYKIGTPLTNRWIVFESGGSGRGYAQTFGSVKPGDYVAGGNYGDDLIRWYNDSGFVTLDVTFECDNTNCSDPNLIGWCLPYTTEATGWMRNTG